MAILKKNKHEINLLLDKKRNLHIAISHFKSLFWSLISHQIREEAEKLGIQFTITTCSDISDQPAGIRNLLKEKIDTLLVVPACSGDPQLIELIKETRALGISVIAMGSEIGSQCESGFVGSNNYRGSAEITDHLFKSMGGKGKVAHLQGVANLGAHFTRSRAFHDTLHKYPDIQLAFEKPLNTESLLMGLATGKESAKQALELNPDLNAIVAETDLLALGAIKAIEEAGITRKILVSGFDGLPEALLAVHAGKLTVTGRQSIQDIAHQALHLSLESIHGEDISERVLTHVELITLDNVLPAISKSLQTIPSMTMRIAESYEIQKKLYDEQQSTLYFLRESEARFRSLTDLSSDWYWEQDENYCFTFHSDTAFGQTDRNPTDYQGKRRWDYPALNMTDADWKKHIAMLDARQPFYDLILKRHPPNSDVVYVSISGKPIFNEDGKFIGYRGIGKNITERKKSEDRIQFLAYHDELTALPNRALFTQQAKHAITKAKRKNEGGIAILFIDLDRFKNINDTLGHSSGDYLLQEVAKRLTNTLRESDMVARLGGDEFIVLLEDIIDPKHAAGVARKILSSILQPISINGQEYQITASIGISTYPQDSHDEEVLMKNADIAMYLAKERGKNNYQFYSAQINVHSFERLALESNLRRALENHEFELHYQPKINIATNQITGMEALIRWQHPDLGMISPAQFIPLAEETGLIIPIGKWVLKTACEQCVAWKKQGFSNIRMAVNLSPRQFNDENLMDYIVGILNATGMPPDLLELEITESMVMYNIHKAIKLITELKHLGIHIAIDDFGTGYSSLSLLKQFPIDTLKIDRSFIKDIPGSTEENAITDAIITMGKALNLNIVAEGVEKEDQLIFLQQHACDEIQGFYFSKPIPPNECIKLIEQNLAKNSANSVIEITKIKRKSK